MFINPIYLIYMYKEGLALNNPQWLICYDKVLSLGPIEQTMYQQMLPC